MNADNACARDRLNWEIDDRGTEGTGVKESKYFSKAVLLYFPGGNVIIKTLENKSNLAMIF